MAMSRTKKSLLAVTVLLLAAAGAGTTYWYRQDTGPQIVTEAIRARDLEAIVSASGKIEPKRQVNISANTMGKVTRLAVEPAIESNNCMAGTFFLLHESLFLP